MANEGSPDKKRRDQFWKAIGTGHWVGTDPSERFPVYTRGNAGEVYPNVFTPLSFSIAAIPGERAMRSAILYSGLIRPEELDGVPITTSVGSGVFGGYAYLNLSIQRVAAGRVPGGSATDADVSFLGVGDPPPYVAQPGDKNLRAGLAGLAFVWKMIRDDGVDFTAKLRDDQRTVERYLDGLGDPAEATDHDLRSDTTSTFIPMFADLFETHLKTSFVAGLLLSVLTSMCEKNLDDPNLAVRLLAGLGDVDSAAPSAALWKLGRTVAADPALTAHFDTGSIADLEARLHGDPAAAGFLEDFAAFTAEFGSRGPNEWDTAFDTWETDPALALALVDRMRGADEGHDPSAQKARLMAEQETLEAETLARLKWPIKKIFMSTLASARLYSQSRERTKTTVVRAIHGARLQAMELDRRMVERARQNGVEGAQKGDLWYVVESELDDYIADPASMAATIAERRALHAELDQRTPPFFFDTTQPPLEEWERKDAARAPVSAGERIEGLPGCLGVARGRARVVTDPADPRGLEPGDVLIAPLTDPSWTPLFVPAEAVVVDVGAVMSHAVIVSRELGIPCAVSVTDASRRIPDGAIIEVNGTDGTVTVIELP